MCKIQIMGILEVEERERNRRNIYSNDSWEFSKVNDRHQTIDPGIWATTKKDIYQRNYTSV